MKFLLLIFTALILASCQSETPIEELSDVTVVGSKNTSKAEVFETVIYIKEGLTISELLDVLIPIDNSAQTYLATANDGTTKTKEKLYEFDQIVVTSESGKYTKTYTIRYFI